MRGRRGDRVTDLLSAKLCYLPACAALLLNALCFTLLDVMTSLSMCDERLPLVECGASDDTVPWHRAVLEWGAAGKAAAKQLARRAARVSGLLRGTSHPGGGARADPDAELRPLVEPQPV